MSLLSSLFKIGGSVLGAKSAKKGINNADRIMSDSEGRVLGEIDQGYNAASEYLRPVADRYAGDDADYRRLLAMAMDGSRYQGFERSPGYDFQMEEMGRATERSQAARGGLLSGRAALELQRRAGGIAAQEYNTWADRQDRNYGLALSGRRDLLNTGISARDRLSDLATGRAQSRSGAIGQVATNRANLAMGKGGVNAQMWGNIGAAASDFFSESNNPFKRKG